MDYEIEQKIKNITMIIDLKYSSSSMVVLYSSSI